MDAPIPLEGQLACKPSGNRTPADFRYSSPLAIDKCRSPVRVPKRKHYEYIVAVPSNLGIQAALAEGAAAQHLMHSLADRILSETQPCPASCSFPRANAQGTPGIGRPAIPFTRGTATRTRCVGHLLGFLSPKGRHIAQVACEGRPPVLGSGRPRGETTV